MNKFVNVALLVFVAGVLGLFIFLGVKLEIRENAGALQEMVDAREIDAREKYELVRANDSLLRDNATMASQRALSQMMDYRDKASAWSKMPEPGSMMLIKPTMDTVVVCAIVAGGTAHEHFVKARVMRMDGFTEDVDPSILSPMKSKDDE